MVLREHVQTLAQVSQLWITIKGDGEIEEMIMIMKKEATEEKKGRRENVLS